MRSQPTPAFVRAKFSLLSTPFCLLLVLQQAFSLKRCVKEGTTKCTQTSTLSHAGDRS